MNFVHATRIVTALLAASALASPAFAADIVVGHVLDLTVPQSISGPGFQGWQNTPAFDSELPVVSIAEGDTFDLTYDFLGSQSLTLTNLSAAWAFLYTSGTSTSSDVTGSGTISFLDSTGNAFLTSLLTTTTEGDFHFGQFFAASNFGSPLPASLTFYGVRYQGTLEDYVEPGLTTRDYASPAFYFTADQAQVNAVPEPATWAMMITGFGVAGAAMRYRRRKTVVRYS